MLNSGEFSTYGWLGEPTKDLPFFPDWLLFTLVEWWWLPCTAHYSSCMARFWLWFTSSLIIGNLFWSIYYSESLICNSNCRLASFCACILALN